VFLFHAARAAPGVDEDSGLRFGAAGMQGWRTGMEDSHLACLDLRGEGSPPAKDPSKKIAAFAVFDGHVRWGERTSLA